MKPFIDNSVAPIIAIDFDGTICIGDGGYPDPHGGQLRQYTKEVMNFMYDIGIKVVIWTNRKNVKDTDIKDKLLMKQWLDELGIKYHTVNDSTEFAPFKYYGRKMYAHMFVDDRSYGFNCHDQQIMLKVLETFLVNIVGCNIYNTIRIITCLHNGTEPLNEDMEHVKDKIRNWNN